MEFGICRQHIEMTKEIGVRKAAMAANPQKFPVKFPVLREFEDQGRSLPPQAGPLAAIRIFATPCVMHLSDMAPVAKKRWPGPARPPSPEIGCARLLRLRLRGLHVGFAAERHHGHLAGA